MDRYKVLRQDLLFHILMLDDENSQKRGSLSNMHFFARESIHPEIPEGIEAQLMVTIGHSDGYAMRLSYVPQAYGYSDLNRLNLDVRKCLSGELGLPFNNQLEAIMKEANLVED